MSLTSPVYIARGNTASGSPTKLLIQNTNSYPAKEIYFEKGTLGPNTTGDLLLDQNAGGIDPDTTVWIKTNGVYVEYSFKVIKAGNLNAQSGVPAALAGVRITVIEIPALGNQRIFFTTSPAGTLANMNALNPGEKTLSNGTFTGPFSPVCFARGTSISCDTGEVFVENLKCGDLVKNIQNELIEILWIGKRYFSHESIMEVKSLAPVRIKTNAMGNGSPTRDLLVSQQHRMLVDNWLAQLMFGEDQVLVAAKYMVNDQSILITYPDEGVEYYHILFKQHQIVIANGALSESFHPGHWAMSTLEEAVRDEIFKIFPELEVNIEAYGASAKPSLKGYEANALYGMMN